MPLQHLSLLEVICQHGVELCVVVAVFRSGMSLLRLVLFAAVSLTILSMLAMFLVPVHRVLGVEEEKGIEFGCSYTSLACTHTLDYLFLLSLFIL